MSIFLGKPSAKICDTLEKRYPKAPFTVNGTNYNTFKDALDAVNSSTAETNTLKVMKNVILDETETTTGAVLPLISKDVTIDFNGKKVVSHDVYSIDGNRFLKSTNAANVTIKNGTFEGDFICNVGNVWNGFFRQCSSGKFTLENANVSILNGKNCSAIKCQTGSVYVKGSTIKQRGASGCVGSEAAGAKVIVEDSTLEAIYDPNAIPGQIGAKDTICNTLNISDNAELSAINSTIRGINTMACVMSMSSGGNVMLSSCNIEYVRDGEVTDLAENGNGCCLYADQGGTVHATYKCYNCTMTHPGLATGQPASDHNLQMFYSTANSTTPAAGVANTFELDYGTFDKFNSLTLGDHLKFTIKNGTFRGNAEEFADDKFKPLIATGYVATKVSDTEYTVAIKPPIHIKSVADLQQLQTEVAAGDNKVTDTYIQDVDLDLTGIAWTGIGTTTTPFAGVYDGNNKKITGITFNIGKYRGLFTVICGATIKNIDITTAGNGFVSDITGEVGGAILVGQSIGSTAINKGSIIENCTVAGNFGSETNPCTHNAAGILGMHDHRNYKTDVKTTTKISNCKVNANIYSDYTKLGGIIAFSQQINYNINGDIEVLSCSVNGILKHVDPNNRNKLGSAEGGFGGIIGWTSGSQTCTTINDCSVICDFSSDKSNMQITNTQSGVGTIGGFIGGPAKSLSSINYVITDQFAHRTGSNSGMLNTEFGIVSPDGSYVTLPKYSDISSINGHATYKLMSYNDTATAALGISVLTEDSYIDIDESLIDASRRGKIHKITHNNVELTGQLVTGTAATYRYKA